MGLRQVSRDPRNLRRRQLRPTRWAMVYPMTNAWGLPTSFHTGVVVNVHTTLFVGRSIIGSEIRTASGWLIRETLVHSPALNCVVSLFVEPGHQGNPSDFGIVFPAPYQSAIPAYVTKI